MYSLSQSVFNDLFMKKLFIVQLLTLFVFTAFSQVKLPRIIRDSMILQRDEKIKIWGWASGSEKVNLRFNGKVYKTKADAAGKWMILLPPTKAGGPYNMDISASNKISIKEILFGDVWFCSGQSSHERRIIGTSARMSSGAKVGAAAYPITSVGCGSPTFMVGQPDLEAGVTASTGLFFCACFGPSRPRFDFRS